MRTHPSVAACLVVAALVLTGCSPRRPVANAPVSDVTTAAVENPRENIIPLPGITDDRPAPADTLGLDRAETAQAAKPNGPKENLDLGFSYYKAKDYVDAARVFDRATRLMPNDPTPLLYLGYTQMAVGALESALKTLQRVTTLPGASPTTISEAYLQIGNCQGALRNDEKAMEAFSKSLANNPKQGLASLALGAWAAQHKQYPQALHYLTDAANNLPPGRQQAQAHAALGRIAEEQKDVKTAAVEYKKALALDEDNAWAKEGLERVKVKKS